MVEGHEDEAYSRFHCSCHSWLHRWGDCLYGGAEQEEVRIIPTISYPMFDDRVIHFVSKGTKYPAQCAPIPHKIGLF